MMKIQALKSVSKSAAPRFVGALLSLAIGAAGCDTQAPREESETIVIRTFSDGELVGSAEGSLDELVDPLLEQVQPLLVDGELSDDLADLLDAQQAQIRSPDGNSITIAQDDARHFLIGPTGEAELLLSDDYSWGAVRNADGEQLEFELDGLAGTPEAAEFAVGWGLRLAGADPTGGRYLASGKADDTTVAALPIAGWVIVAVVSILAATHVATTWITLEAKTRTAVACKAAAPAAMAMISQCCLNSGRVLLTCGGASEVAGGSTSNGTEEISGNLSSSTNGEMSLEYTCEQPDFSQMSSHERTVFENRCEIATRVFEDVTNGSPQSNADIETDPPLEDINFPEPWPTAVG